MTIHPIRLTGLVIGVPQTFEYLDKMQERVIRFVTKHSKVTEDRFKELMFAKFNARYWDECNWWGCSKVRSYR